MLEDIKKRIEKEIPRSHVKVREYKPDHFSIDVASSAFSGKTLVEQHKMVHKALKGMMGTRIHAVNINTKESV